VKISRREFFILAGAGAFDLVLMACNRKLTSDEVFARYTYQEILASAELSDIVFTETVRQHLAPGEREYIWEQDVIIGPKAPRLRMFADEAERTSQSLLYSGINPRQPLTETVHNPLLVERWDKGRAWLAYDSPGLGRIVCTELNSASVGSVTVLPATNPTTAFMAGDFRTEVRMEMVEIDESTKLASDLTKGGSQVFYKGDSGNPVRMMWVG